MADKQNQQTPSGTSEQQTDTVSNVHKTSIQQPISIVTTFESQTASCPNAAAQLAAVSPNTSEGAESFHSGGAEGRRGSAASTGSAKRRRIAGPPETAPGGVVLSPRSHAYPMSERQQLALLKQISGDASSPRSPSSGCIPSALPSPGLTGGTPQARAGSVPVCSTTLTQVQSTPSSSTPRSRLARVHKRNERGETALHIAAKKGDHRRCLALLQEGADVNARDHAGWAPLHEACNHDMYRAAKVLVRKGADVNAPGLDNDMPLHDAAANNSAQLVLLLLRHGARVDQTNNRGKRPCDLCTNDECVKLLKEGLSSEQLERESARSPAPTPELPSRAVQPQHQPSALSCPAPQLPGSGATAQGYPQQALANPPSGTNPNRESEGLQKQDNCSADPAGTSPSPSLVASYALARRRREYLRNKRKHMQMQAANQSGQPATLFTPNKRRKLTNSPNKKGAASNVGVISVISPTSGTSRPADTSTGGDVFDFHDSDSDHSDSRSLAASRRRLVLPTTAQTSTSPNSLKPSAPVDSVGTEPASNSVAADVTDCSDVSSKTSKPAEVTEQPAKIAPSVAVPHSAAAYSKKKRLLADTECSAPPAKSDTTSECIKRAPACPVQTVPAKPTQSGAANRCRSLSPRPPQPNRATSDRSRTLLASLSIDAARPIEVTFDRTSVANAAWCQSQTLGSGTAPWSTQNVSVVAQQQSEQLNVLVEEGGVAKPLQQSSAEQKVPPLRLLINRGLSPNDSGAPPAGADAAAASPRVVKQSPTGGELKTPVKPESLITRINRKDLPLPTQWDASGAAATPTSTMSTAEVTVHITPSPSCTSLTSVTASGATRGGKKAAKAARLAALAQGTQNELHWSQVAGAQMRFTDALHAGNCYDAYRGLRKEIARRWYSTAVEYQRAGDRHVHDTPRIDTSNFLLAKRSYLTKDKWEEEQKARKADCGGKSPRVPDCMAALHSSQSAERDQLQVRQRVERERLALTVERLVLRMAARRTHGFKPPLSVCRMFRDMQVYNTLELDVPNTLSPNSTSVDRSGQESSTRQPFAIAISAALVQFEKNKRELLSRHRCEADALQATQHLSWQSQLRARRLWPVHEAWPLDGQLLPKVHVPAEREYQPQVESAMRAATRANGAMSGVGTPADSSSADDATPDSGATPAATPPPCSNSGSVITTGTRV